VDPTAGSRLGSRYLARSALPGEISVWRGVPTRRHALRGHLQRRTGYEQLARLRIERVRRVVAARKLRLRAAWEALEAFDELLVAAQGQYDPDQFDDDPQEAGLRVRRAAPAQRRQWWGPTLDRRFEQFLGDDEGWDSSEAEQDLWDPRVDEIDRRLDDFGLGTAGRADLQHVYTDYGNGD
jgi:hypothetical protein